MTPFEISVLMHYATRCDDFRQGDFTAPVLAPTLAHFVETGMLKKLPPDSLTRYAPTEATRVYLEALCAVPLPVQRWVVPSRTNEDRRDG